MIDALIGGMIGVVVTTYLWLRPYRKLQAAYCDLLETSTRMQIEYFDFRRQFNEYRARFDPVDLTRDGNVTYIRKGKDE